MVLVTYACINQIEAVDYLGIYNPSMMSIITMVSISAVVTVLILFLNSKLLTND